MAHWCHLPTLAHSHRSRVEPDPSPLVSTENEHTFGAGAAKASVAVSPPVPADADLRAILEAWPALPVAVRAGILAMVRASTVATPRDFEGSWALKKLHED